MAQVSVLLKDCNNDTSHFLKYTIQNGQRTYLLNDKKESISKINKKISTILFTPDSLSCIKLDSSKKRELIDDFIPLIHSRGHDIIHSYNKILKMRNKILKDFLKEEVSLIQTKRLLESIETTYLEKASWLTLVRYETLKVLEPLTQEILASLHSNSGAFEMKYQISGEEPLGENNSSFKELYSAMHKKLLERREIELARGITLVGPQKHDISFFYRAQDARFYCSQGEQRMLILALKVAQIVYYKKERKEYPILMLDDVLSELDQKNQKNLIEFLDGLETQIFLTTTEIHPLFKGLSQKNILKIEELKQ